MAENVQAQQSQTEAATTETAAPKQDAVASQSETAAEATSKLLAGKFKAVPDLEKSYQEAQKELTKAKQELAELRKAKAAPVAEETKTEATETTKSKETPAQRQSRVGEVLMQEYMEKGALSAEAKAKAMEELGLPPNVIAEFEKYLVTQKEAGLKKIKDTFSEFGDFNIEEVIDTMSRTLPAERLAAIQTLVDAGDIEVLRPYIKNHVKAKLPEAQVGKAGGSGAGGFKDKETLRKAMNDPRFGTDKAYTADFWKRNEATPENFRLSR